MKKFFLLLASFSSALMATLCCLPALIFLIFGTSFSFLSFLNSLSEYRILFSIVSVICFVFWGFVVFKKDKKCDLNLKKRRKPLAISLAIVLLALLFYPEILGKIYE